MYTSVTEIAEAERIGKSILTPRMGAPPAAVNATSPRAPAADPKPGGQSALDAALAY